MNTPAGAARRSLKAEGRERERTRTRTQNDTLATEAGTYARVKPGKRPFNLHTYFMTNPSLSGRGAALGGKAVPKLRLTQRG